MLTVVELLQACSESFEVEEAVVLGIEFLPQGSGPVLPLRWRLGIHGLPSVEFGLSRFHGSDAEGGR